MSALKMPPHPMPDIEPLRVGSQKPLHPRHQSRLRRLPHQMKMISHQAIRMHLLSRLLASLPQRFQKPPPILVIQKNRLLPIPPAHHMIIRSCVFQAQLPCHRKHLSEFKNMLICGTLFLIQTLD